MAEVPTYVELMWPTLRALREMHGSGANGEIDDRVTEALSISEAMQAVRASPASRDTKLKLGLRWARTHLKGVKALENPTSGFWVLTDLGSSISESQLKKLHGRYRASLPSAQDRKTPAKSGRTSEESKRTASTPPPPGTSVDESTAEGDTEAWKDELLDAITAQTPEGFERLARLLLHEAGFINTRVMGQPGDGGVDGIGTYRLSLVSFPVYFQCKRYKGSVAAKEVRDFRGAMDGRGDRGLLISTGTFTRQAKQEAARDGASPIDLIDGSELCDLLRQHAVGVRVETREEVFVNRSFFEQV